MFTHILIPISDNPGSRRAIRLGVALAKELDARVTGFHAMTEFNHVGIVEELLESPPVELRVFAHARADKLFAVLQREADLARVQCDTIAKQGDQPYEEIIAQHKAPIVT